ncbi:vitellogenin-like [Centruroides vittatus]|uniref:vitellogenin-like n=1 Tax=Centruroides vittatus TaxID=120091 RepID=UPI00350EDDB6
MLIQIVNRGNLEQCSAIMSYIIMDLKLLFIFLFFIGIVFADPHSRQNTKCSRKCKNTGEKFRYKEQTTYFYDFESTNFFRATKFLLKPFAIKAKVEISNLGNCDMALEIKNATLFISGEEEDKITELMQFPLLFSFEDGKIAEICPWPNDDKTINIKRAILSAFQNTMSSFDMDYEQKNERDIVGTCNTVFGVIERSNRTVIVKKAKDFAECEFGRTGNTALLTALLLKSKGLPVMDDLFFNCVQIIEEGIITNVSCIEYSIFKISENTSIYTRRTYKTKAEVKLILKSVRRLTSFTPYKIVRRDELFYSNQPEMFSNFAFEKALRILRNLCSEIHHIKTINPETPKLFSRLVQTLRKVQPGELQDIYDKMDREEICQSLWLKSLLNDALPHIGHEGSVKLMAKKIQSDTVSKIQTTFWVTSLAFIQYPTEDAILSAVPLLDYEKAGKQALLAITAMSHNYCTKNTNCEQSEAIQQAIKSLKRYLNYKCNVYQPAEIKQVIAALKGFGNLGRVGEASRQILECAAEPSNEITIRLAAIEAFRRTPCKEEVKQQLLNIFSRRDEHVEVRIAAYLGAMKCADREVVKRIKQIYDSERLSQIKAFVYSHMTNLQESSSSEKEDIRRIVLEFQFQPQQLDIRKYSQNIEWSVYQNMNLNREFESNVIYSLDSFIPRSFMTNLTSVFYGNIINNIEVGVF